MVFLIIYGAVAFIYLIIGIISQRKQVEEYKDVFGICPVDVQYGKIIGLSLIWPVLMIVAIIETIMETIAEKRKKK